MLSVRNAPRDDDEGFGLAEMLTSMAVIATTMAAMGPFLVRSVQSVSHQRSSQAAVQLANTAIEQVRALKGSSLRAGRGQTKSTEQWNTAPAVVRPYLDSLQLTWDPETGPTSTQGDDAPIPTATQTITVEKTAYRRTVYVGICDIYVGGTGACVNPAVYPPPADSIKDLKFFRVVVLVQWRGRECASSACSYVATTLVARAPEPTFDFHRPAPLVKVVPLTFYRGVLNSFQMEATGGQLPNTWTGTAFPGPVSISSVGVISGTPTTLGSAAAQVTVTDKLGRGDTERVDIVIVNPPTLSAPASAANVVNEAVNLQLTGSAGVTPYTYSATGLPPGLTLNPNTGAITGTVTTAGTYTVAVTLKDANPNVVTSPDVRQVTRTYTHTVHPPLSLATIANQTVTMGSAISATANASGGNGTYTYSAAGLPLGTVINPVTGAISGIATVPGRYLPVVTVTDGAGRTATTTFTVVINTATALVFTSPALTAADRSSPRGTATAVTFLTNASALGINTTMTAVGLPPGLNFSPGTGTISGTPTTAGVYKVTVTAVSPPPPSPATTLTFLWTIT